VTLVLAFSPFILFSVLSRLSADLALWIAFAAAFVVTIRDFIESPSLRLLDGASLVLFGALALLRGFLEPELPLAAVRTIVDAGLLAVIILSLVRGRPLSLAYCAGARCLGAGTVPARQPGYQLGLGGRFCPDGGC